MQIEIYSLIINNILQMNLTAVCDIFSSLIWDVEYFQCGEFEIYVTATAKMQEIFQIGRLVMRSDDAENIGIIEKVHLKTDAENGDYLTISGRFLLSVLARRIIDPQIYFNDVPYGQIVQQMIQQNAVYTLSARIIPSLIVHDDWQNCENWLHQVSLSAGYENLMDWIFTVCKQCGGSIQLNFEENGLHFHFFQGTDRSIMQEKNPHIIFSDNYNTLLTFEQVTDKQKFANYVCATTKTNDDTIYKAYYYHGYTPEE